MPTAWDTYQATRERLTASGRLLTDAQAVVLTYLAAAGRRGLTEDELQDARKLTGITDPTVLVRHVLAEYVRRLHLDRLAKGGFAPDFEGPPRRRPPHFRNDLDEDGNPIPE